jgi:hypothetical protein
LLAIMEQSNLTPEEKEQQKKDQRPFDRRAQEVIEWIDRFLFKGGKGTPWSEAPSFDERFSTWPAQPQSGTDEGLPKSEQERLADLEQKKQSDRELADEVKMFAYDMSKLNALTAAGGPEGGKGPSGYQNEWVNDLAPAAFDARFKGGLLAGSYNAIVDAARENNMPPSLMAGIMGLETGWGKAPSTYLSQHNNPAGIMAGIAKDNKVPQHFANLAEGIKAAAAVQKRIYDQGGRTIRGMGAIYAPAGARNDPRGTNKYWPGNVTKIQSSLQQIGTGLPPVTPAEVSLEDGGQPIMTHLASRDRGVNGSATVDIDVSGLGEQKRKPSDLFRPQVMRGVVQMSNNTRPDDNPLSFE